MTKTTTIKTAYDRELVVKDYLHNFNLFVKDTDGKYAVKGEIYTSLDPTEAKELGLALLGENATVITDLPKAENDGTYAETPNGVYRRLDANPAEILEHAKDLLAIHATLVTHNEEQEAARKAEEKAAKAAAEKAKEAARDKRRDELGNQFRGLGEGYGPCTIPTKAAIDYIIDLEEAAKVS